MEVAEGVETEKMVEVEDPHQEVPQEVMGVMEQTSSSVNPWMYASETTPKPKSSSHSGNSTITSTIYLA